MGILTNFIRTWYADGARRPALTYTMNYRLKALRLFKSPVAGGGAYVATHYRPSSLLDQKPQ